MEENKNIVNININQTNQIPEQNIEETKKLKSKKATFIILGIIFVLIIAGVVYYKTPAGNTTINNIININSNSMTGNAVNLESNMILLKTNYGDIKIKLYNDMPITTGNFKSLVQKGTYNGVIFHRVIDKFMIQGGDPTGTGYGDSKIPNIKDEFTHKPANKNNRGTISMANAGPNTGSSQFFINLVNNNFLDTKHPAFGEVIEGMDVVDKIAKVQTDSNDKPIKDVKIIEARIV